MINKRIIWDQDGSISICIPSVECQDIDAEAKKIVPAGTAYEIVDAADIPTDRTFRNAWKHDTSKSAKKVKTDMTVAKTIAHDVRRAEREAAFAPHDKMATVPALAADAEAARVVIRDADALKQKAIDAARSEASLKTALLG